jgi:hypothetical protein
VCETPLEGVAEDISVLREGLAPAASRAG